MSDLGPLSLGNTVDTLSNAMTGASVEHDAISNNIANVNTPGYRRQSVSFREALSAASGDAGQGDELEMTSNDDRDLGGAAADTPVAFDPQPQADPTLQMRADKSNVDVDQEMARLSQNSAYGQTMAQLLQVQFMRLRESISGNP